MNLPEIAALDIVLVKLLLGASHEDFILAIPSVICVNSTLFPLLKKELEFTQTTEGMAKVSNVWCGMHVGATTTRYVFVSLKNTAFYNFDNISCPSI